MPIYILADLYGMLQASPRTPRGPAVSKALVSVLERIFLFRAGGSTAVG